MSEQSIDVCLAADDNYFVGLSQVVLSLCRSAPEQNYHIHIIDGGISDERKKSLKQLVEKINLDNSITFYPFDQSSLEGFSCGPGHSYMAYARIFMPSIVQIPRVIYLDSDLLILGNLRELWNLDLAGKSIAAAYDPTIQWLEEDFPFDRTCPKVRYFNSGVMLIDLDAWRQENIQKHVLNLILENPKQLNFWDQTALNALFEGNVVFIEQKWNSKISQMQFPYANHLVLHFLSGAKPWKTYPYLLHDRVWNIVYQHLLGGDSIKLLLLQEDGKRKYKDGLVAKFALLFMAQKIIIKFKQVLGRDSGMAQNRLNGYQKMRQDYLQGCKHSDAKLRAWAKNVYGE